MDRDGYTPVAVHKDAVYLVSDEPDPVTACPPSVTLGTGLGHFKVQDTGSVRCHGPSGPSFARTNNTRIIYVGAPLVSARWMM